MTTTPDDPAATPTPKDATPSATEGADASTDTTAAAAPASAGAKPRARASRATASKAVSTTSAASKAVASRGQASKAVASRSAASKAVASKAVPQVPAKRRGAAVATTPSSGAAPASADPATAPAETRKATKAAMKKATTKAPAGKAPAKKAPAAKKAATTKAAGTQAASAPPAPLPWAGTPAGFTASQVKHPTVEEREARGRVRRAEYPRKSLAECDLGDGRPDPIDLLMGQAETRIPILVPLRHARMVVSPFTFYRGAAIVMAADLARQPRSGIDVQLCGDAHLLNLGLYAAPDRRLVFDLNDFDETNPGPFEWDVKRLATSFILAARDIGASESVAREMARGVGAVYRYQMNRYAQLDNLDIWYDRIDADVISRAAEDAGKKAKARVEDVFSEARARTGWSAVRKLTEVVDGERRFKTQLPILVRLGDDSPARSVLREAIRRYRSTLLEDRQLLLQRYEPIDIAHKVVGVGSVGLAAFVILMKGRDDDDLMALQVKQAEASVLEAYTKSSRYSQHGHRVVAGQRYLQAATDAFLGWMSGLNRDYYVRQLRDMKWAPDVTRMGQKYLGTYMGLCAAALARAHARAGDPIEISSYLGTGDAFDKAIESFSATYADQVVRDHAAFKAAIADGRVPCAADPEGTDIAKAVVEHGYHGEMIGTVFPTQ